MPGRLDERAESRMVELAHHLTVKTPGGSMSDLTLRSDRVVIGRDADCDVVLESPYVSRRHAAVEARDAHVYVTDLQSRNGVLVNGRRVAREQRLRPGDEIGIGDCSLTYVEHAAGGESTQLFLGAAGADDAYIFVDMEAWEVWVRGEPLARKLTHPEMTVLQMLFANNGNVCAREALGDAVWGKGQYGFNLLHQLMRRLKEKIEPEPKRPRYIESIAGVGYKLNFAQMRPRRVSWGRDAEA